MNAELPHDPNWEVLPVEAAVCAVIVMAVSPPSTSGSAFILVAPLLTDPMRVACLIALTLILAGIAGYCIASL